MELPLRGNGFAFEVGICFLGAIIQVRDCGVYAGLPSYFSYFGLSRKALCVVMCLRVFHIFVSIFSFFIPCPASCFFFSLGVVIGLL